MTRRTKGKITHWNEGKGYGFITPTMGAKQVFVHIRAFNNRQQPPQLNQLVTFSMSSDKQGRPCAINVTRVGEKQPREAKRNDRILIILIAVTFIATVGLSVAVNKLPIEVFYLYLAASALIFVVYAKDKSAARRGAWRTPESTLHALALIGGWPGALIAQQMLKHKSRKQDFRFVFWVTVVVNCGAFGWLFTAKGGALLGAVIAGVGR